MKIINWQRLLWQITLWMIAEIILGTLGLDDLADYSEFQIGKNHSPNQIFKRLI